MLIAINYFNSRLITCLSILAIWPIDSLAHSSLSVSMLLMCCCYVLCISMVIVDVTITVVNLQLIRHYIYLFSCNLHKASVCLLPWHWPMLIRVLKTLKKSVQGRFRADMKICYSFINRELTMDNHAINRINFFNRLTALCNI